MFVTSGGGGGRGWGRDVLLGVGNAAKHPTMHKTAPHNKESSTPKFQKC